MKKLTEAGNQSKEGPRRPGLEWPNGRGVLQAAAGEAEEGGNQQSLQRAKAEIEEI